VSSELLSWHPHDLNRGFSRDGVLSGPAKVAVTQPSALFELSSRRFQLGTVVDY